MTNLNTFQVIQKIQAFIETAAAAGPWAAHKGCCNLKQPLGCFVQLDIQIPYVYTCYDKPYLS